MMSDEQERRKLQSWGEFCAEHRARWAGRPAPPVELPPEKRRQRQEEELARLGREEAKLSHQARLLESLRRENECIKSIKSEAKEQAKWRRSPGGGKRVRLA